LLFLARQFPPCTHSCSCGKYLAPMGMLGFTQTQELGPHQFVPCTHGRTGSNSPVHPWAYGIKFSRAAMGVRDQILPELGPYHRKCTAAAAPFH
jgi:hypothetical protein